MRQFVYVVLVAALALAMSTVDPLVMGASAKSLAGYVEDLDHWVDSVGKKCQPYIDEDTEDEDHLPARPAFYEDKNFAQFLKQKLQKLNPKKALNAAKKVIERHLKENDDDDNKKSKSSKKKQNDDSDNVLVVAKDGSGDFKSVQAAIDKVPKNNKKRVIIYVKRGVYREKLRIPKSKPFVTLKGEGAALTYIQWNDTASTLGKDGKPLSTYGSASIAIEADNFFALDISFKNTAPPPPSGAVGKQAVAVRIQGDKAAFYRCNFYGAQDTLYDRAGRHYYYKCYIEGSIDFIFGNARSLFVRCQIHSIATPWGSITAQKRLVPSENTGYSFVYCVVTGSGSIYLGRAWGPYSRVVYAHTYFDNIIRPEGWNDFGLPSNQKKVYYGEYKCFGPGANINERVPWSKKLTNKQAQPFLSLAFIDGKEWVPKV